MVYLKAKNEEKLNFFWSTAKFLCAYFGGLKKGLQFLKVEFSFWQLLFYVKGRYLQIFKNAGKEGFSKQDIQETREAGKVGFRNEGMRAKITDFLEFTVTPKNIPDQQHCVVSKIESAKLLHSTRDSPGTTS